MVIYAVNQTRSSFVPSLDPQRFMRASQDNITRRTQQQPQPQPQPQPEPQQQAVQQIEPQPAPQQPQPEPQQQTPQQVEPQQPQQPEQQPQQPQPQQQPQSRRERFLANLREQRIRREQEQAARAAPRQTRAPVQRAHSFVPPQGANAFRPNVPNTTAPRAPPPMERAHTYIPQVDPHAFRPRMEQTRRRARLPQFTRITEENQKVYENTTRQVMSELKEMNALSFGEGQISVEMENDSPFALVLTLAPNDGLYKDGEYKIAMTIPTKYPNAKPSFQFLTPIFHPNVSEDGTICFSLLSENDSRLRIADYAHGMLWLLYYPNLYSRMNSDCPQNEKRYAQLVRQSILGGCVAGRNYKRSPRLPAESSSSSSGSSSEEGSGKGKEKASSDYLRNENEEAAWEWRLVGEEWIQVFEEDFDKIAALQAAAEAKRIEDDYYYNACFAGQCRALMADGSHTRLDRLRRGDLVSTGPDTPPAEIRCVVRTQIANQTPSLVHLPGGLMVTETHPVRTSPQSGQWVFPRDLSTARPTPGVPHIFSFVLEGRGQEGNGAGMVIEGVECIGLAHGVEGDEVATHPFFGTERIVEELGGLRGWEGGMVTLGEGAFRRSEETGMLDGLIAEREIVDEI